MGRKKRRSTQFRNSSQVIDIEEARKERQAKRAKQHKRKEAQEEKTRKRVNNARQNRRKLALRRRQQRRKLIIAGVALILLVLVGISAGNIFVLKHDLHNAEKQKQAYIEEKQQLEKDMRNIDDLENLEEQARDQMRLIKPGEILYIFPENMTNQ